MKTFTLIRSPEGDGNTGGGGDTSTQTQQTSQPSPVQSLWGGAEAPTWVKESGLEKSHQTTDKPAGEQTQQQDTTQQTQQVQQTQVATTAAPAAKSEPAITVDTLAAAIAKGIQGQHQEKNPGAPALTDAQLKQQLGVYEMSREDYKEMFGVEPTSDAQLAKANAVFQAVAKQAVTIASVFTQRALNEHQQSLNPYVTAIRSQEAVRQEAAFYAENSDLKGYEAMARNEFNLLLASGQKFSSPEEARKTVAERTRATLKAVGITPKAPTSSGQQQTQSTTNRTTTSPSSSRSMTTTSVGGRSGGSATQSKPATSIEAVWGKK